MPLDPSTGVRIVRLAERFPEPAFSALQRQVFAALQQASSPWAQALAAESAAQPAATLAEQPPMVRFGAYEGDELVGWSCGWFERGRAYYMANSGVRPSHQRRGIYGALLAAVLAFARDGGAVLVRSQHSVLNNAVLLAKLARGFHISGLNQSAQMGLLVELTHHLAPDRAALYAQRCLPFTVPDDPPAVPPTIHPHDVE